MSQNELNPNYSSSEDEEEASGSEDDLSSGSESDSPSDSPPKTLIPPPESAINLQAPDISSESEESGSDTDSDSDSPANKPAAVDPNIKPIRSIPMELNLESELAQKSVSGSGSGLLPAPARTNCKRLVAMEIEKEAKKPKSNSTDEESKKQLFQRLWSEDDEIVILKGMIDCKAENNENLVADMGAFHDYIKNKLHIDVSRAQLADKIRRLKRKYVNNVSKEKDGKDRSFSKSHEQRGYELSKLIWGSNSNNISNSNSNSNNNNMKNGNVASTSGVTLVKCNGVDVGEGLEVEVGERMDVSRFVRFGGGRDGPVLIEEIVKAGMELAEGSKRVELEERWRKLKEEELEIYLKKIELVKEQGLVVLEAVNSSGN